MGLTVSDRVRQFLARTGGQRFCDECLARVTKIRNVEQVRSTIAMLATDPAYRVQDADCSHCGETRRTIMAVWGGL